MDVENRAKEGIEVSRWQEALLQSLPGVGADWTVHAVEVGDWLDIPYSSHVGYPHPAGGAAGKVCVWAVEMADG